MEETSLVLWIAAFVLLLQGGCEPKQKVTTETNTTVVAKTYTDTAAGDWR